MKLRKNRSVRGCTTPQNKGTGWAAVAGSVAVVGLLGCGTGDGIKVTPLEEKTAPAEMRCYDPGDDRIHVYVEDNSGKTELGEELQLSISELGIKTDGSKGLAYSCTRSGHLFWVTEDTVYIRKISAEQGGLKVEKILESKHTAPDEYTVPGVRVVGADIWANPHAKWEEITVATITNTGLFQVVRFSLEDKIDGRVDRAISDLTRKIKKENRWPSEHVRSAAIKITDGKSFAVIPLGEQGQGNVTKFYNIFFSGEEGTRLMEQESKIETVKLLGLHPDLRNVFDIAKPIRFDRELGGWIVNLTAEKQNGDVFGVFPIVSKER